MRIFKNQFFATKAEAKAFQKAHGGAYYSNEKGSRTKRDYMTELSILCPPDAESFAAKYPHVIAWTIFC